MALLAISSGDASARIDPANGGRVTSLVLRGTELVAGEQPGFGGFEWGIYPMVPFAGRVRDGMLSHRGTRHRLPLNAGPHAMHGFGHDLPCQLKFSGLYQVCWHLSPCKDWVIGRLGGVQHMGACCAAPGLIALLPMLPSSFFFFVGEEGPSVSGARTGNQLCM